MFQFNSEMKGGVVGGHFVACMLTLVREIYGLTFIGAKYYEQSSTASTFSFSHKVSIFLETSKKKKEKKFRLDDKTKKNT